MYGLTLQNAGYYVAAFHDPDSFLRSLDVGLPDVVVLDWNLPVKDGADVLKSLREDARSRRVPVIVLSNLPGTAGGGLEEARDLGIVGWLEKPKTAPAALAATIAGVVPTREPAS